MRLKAYLLAADPTWIEASVLSYYHQVEEIIVSYDENQVGWTGAPVAVDECLDRLKAIDTDKKMRYMPGHYARLDHPPMDNETYQRQCALDVASHDADWVLQLDADEVIPHIDALIEMLSVADQESAAAVEWPMRVLFRRLPSGAYLQVCASDGSDCFEYPAPVAVRAGAMLEHARRAHGLFLRPVVAGDDRSLQVSRPAEPNERRVALPNAADAIIHNSWARPAPNIRSKIASWGHNAGWRSWAYYYLCWKPTPNRWRKMRNFHPFSGSVWPALKTCELNNSLTTDASSMALLKD